MTFPMSPPDTLQVGNVTLLQNYYMQAYATVRKYSSCIVALCPPESQSDGSAFQFFMAGGPYTKVIQDVHKCAFRILAVGSSCFPSQHPDRQRSPTVGSPDVTS